MHRLFGLTLLLLAASALAGGWSLRDSLPDQAADDQSPPPGSARLVLATVNGVAIREADVRLALRDAGRDEAASAAHKKNVLERIIEREVTAQRAAQLGLDSNAAYQEKLRGMEARINAFKRAELSKLFQRREVAEKARVGEAQAQAYFDEHKRLIRTELHVWQILRRSEADIERAASELRDGKSFEQVAGQPFQNLPKLDRAPWDLGYLRWHQVPKSWRSEIYEIERGGVSGVLRGPNNRFWIIKLVDRRENRDLLFAEFKSTLMKFLTSERTEALREKTAQALRAQARIEYVNLPEESPGE